MAGALVQKLLNSFDDLERCISLTLDVFGGNDNIPEDVVVRVRQYSQIVAKQRVLAKQLEEYIDAENWREVGRLVKVINGLSGMIRDDAQAILASAAGSEGSEDAPNMEAQKLC